VAYGVSAKAMYLYSDDFLYIQSSVRPNAQFLLNTDANVNVNVERVRFGIVCGKPIADRHLGSAYRSAWVTGTRC